MEGRKKEREREKEEKKRCLCGELLRSGAELEGAASSFLINFTGLRNVLFIYISPRREKNITRCVKLFGG